MRCYLVGLLIAVCGSLAWLLIAVLRERQRRIASGQPFAVMLTVEPLWLLTYILVAGVVLGTACLLLRRLGGYSK